MIDLKDQIPIQEIFNKEDNEYKNFLKSIQANIVRSHYCNYCRYIFIRFNQESKINEIKKWLSKLEITNAFQLLDDFSERNKLKEDSIFHFVSPPKVYPETGDPLNVADFEQIKDRKKLESIVCLLFISDIGWDFLDFKNTEIRNSINTDKYENFKAAIHHGIEKDIDSTINNDNYPHIMIQVASKNEDPVYLNNFIANLMKGTGSLGFETHTEEGHTISKLDTYIGNNGEVQRKYDWKEPFEFSDGVSQPFFFKNLTKNVASKTDKWSPDAFLELAFNERDNPVEQKFKIYFSTAVYMKIQQFKDDFDANIKVIADKLEDKISSEEKIELAEAYIMGRFKDGTPVETSYKKNGGENILNNFVFGEYAYNSKCPYFSHIFKANPRKKDQNGEYIRIVRRGIPYKYDENGKESKGLHFLSYQKSIKDQFFQIYVKWIKSPYKPLASTRVGYDLLFGNIDENSTIKIPKVWGQANDFIYLNEIFKDNSWKKSTAVRGCVFFIVPDLNFIKNIEQM